MVIAIHDRSKTLSLLSIVHTAIQHLSKHIISSTFESCCLSSQPTIRLNIYISFPDIRSDKIHTQTQTFAHYIPHWRVARCRPPQQKPLHATLTENPSTRKILAAHILIRQELRDKERSASGWAHRPKVINQNRIDNGAHQTSRV